jgi:O-antigen/teichoic acid export membrane protein
VASRIRQLASETAVYGVASILSRLINFALVPFYTNVLPVDHYGVVILVYTALVFLQIVFTYGMESAYLRYASGDEGRDRVKETFSSAVWSILATSLALSLLFAVFSSQTAWIIGIQERWIDLIYLSLAILSFDALAIVPMAELRLSNRPWRFAMARLLHVVVNVGLNLYLIPVIHEKQLVGVVRSVDMIHELAQLLS